MTAHEDVNYYPIRQLRRTKNLHRILHHRLSVPLDIAERAINGLKFVWNPGQVRHRTRLAAALQQTSADARLKQHGYLHLDTARMSGLQAALDDCTQCYDNSLHTGTAETVRSAGPKPFLVSLIKDEQLLEHEAVLKFVVSPPLVKLAAKYFGSVPMLSGVRLWWTPPNDTASQSQLFHCDREDRKQLKVLVNVMETTPDTGPFTLIPADESARIKAALKYSYKTYRLSDQDISQVGAPSEIVSLTGPPGSMACVDTSRCLHYGSRNNSRSRLVLMIQFTDCLAPNVTLPKWHVGLSKLGLELDELQCLALGVCTV